MSNRTREPNKRTKLAITTRALIQRINRKLKPEGEMLKTGRGRARGSVGEYYVVNFNRNWITRQHVDLEALGRELGCLMAWEELRDE